MYPSVDVLQSRGAVLSVDVDVIPSELWCDIYAKLDSFLDQVNFRAVRKSWRSLLPPPRHPPCLLLDETVGRDETPPRRHFICLEKLKVHKVNFWEIHDAHCVGSAGNWLLTVDKQKKTNSTNLFSRALTHPIPDDRVIDEDGVSAEDKNLNKVVLSSSQCDGQSCSAVALYEGGEISAAARTGDASWTMFPDESVIADIIFHKQEFYAIDMAGKLILCNIGDYLCPPTLSYINDGHEDDFEEDEDEDEGDDENEYPHGSGYEECLVEWLGKLLVIEFLYPFVERAPGRITKGQTDEINIYMLDLSSGKRTVMESLGEHSLFVGHKNTCASVVASDYFGLVRKNCIYFVERDRCESTENSYEVRVFDVEDESITTYYKGIPGRSPPIWIVPSPTTN